MKITIIGATRGIGAQLLNQALARHHQVTVLARQPARIQLTHNHLTVLHGDIRDATSVSAAIDGQDIVCITIGVPITFQPVTVFSEGTKQVIAAMQRHRLKRLLCVTGIGAGDSKGHGGFLYDSIFKPLLLKTIYEDKDRQEELIKESDLNWVIIRPAGLTNGALTRRYRVLCDLTGINSKRISRADVADFMLHEIDEPRYTHQTPLLTY